MKKLLVIFLIPILLLSCSDSIDKQNAVEVNSTNKSHHTDTESLSKQERNWFYQIRTDETPSTEPKEVLDIINKYDGFYLGDTSKKYIYLTFDEGYENGNTSKILDILKENNVKASFFVTAPYIKTSSDLILRMVSEGHLVCNHSAHHPSMAKIYDTDKFNKELTLCEDEFYKLTGKPMPKFFRPPMGKYSEYSLYLTSKLGYKTVFWSFAYADWDIKKQPSKEYAMKKIMDRTHPGGIYLFHAVSNTNAEILDQVIKKWKEKGYSFKSLSEI
ncbi:MAG: delta-lactam-biosynthetic de-N-acetylase [Bacillota bacterium]|nr:delta-lactam-biosynthetic de-N-acetylase [Bacillota bacterium]